MTTNHLFFDTCSLLNAQEKAFELDDKFYISSITLKELEGIKTSGTKDEETKYHARKILNLLDENEDKFEVVLYKESYFLAIADYDFEKIPDTKIIASAYHLKQDGVDVTFVTHDKACREIAAALGLFVKRPSLERDNYQGFKEVILDDTQLAEFYEKIKQSNLNLFNLLDNEYLLIKDSSDKIIDKYKWSNEEYIPVPYYKFESRMFGKTVAKNGDPYQQIAMDALSTSKITLLKGHAGTGKSCLSFAYMLSQLERGKIDRIIVFTNTVAAKGAAKLGFYPGDKNDKLLDSQIGNFLVSKLGDRIAVERMIDDGVLVLLPMSDIRGYDTSGIPSAVYITEAQNLDIDLMKLALQRIGEDSVCILDGDEDTQVDMSMYAGENNGMRRVSKVFRGEDIYAEVELQNIYRSRIAELAEKM